jgi:hypothetical protein
MFPVMRWDGSLVECSPSELNTWQILFVVEFVQEL